MKIRLVFLSYKDHDTWLFGFKIETKFISKFIKKKINTLPEPAYTQDGLIERWIRVYVGPFGFIIKFISKAMVAGSFKIIDEEAGV